MVATIETSIEIHASPSTIYAILTDFEAYKDWNPQFSEGRGKAIVGGEPPELRAPQLSFRPTILVADQDKELRWSYSILLKGFFYSEHIFTITPVETDEQTGVVTTARFDQNEEFNGLAMSLFRWLGMLEDVKAQFIMVNEAIKKRAEEAEAKIAADRLH